MKIKNIHFDKIKDLAFEEQMKCNGKDEEADLTKINSAFCWRGSTLGYFFWNAVNDEKYNYARNIFDWDNDTNNMNTVFNPQPHYDNTNGSLYKIAEQRGWNAYTFDCVKRLDRAGKKDNIRQEIQKSIDVLTIWLNEL
jgi:hypothetical protein